MKPITFPADDALVEQAQRQAQLESSTQEELSHTSLECFVAPPDAAERYAALMAELAHVRAGRRFTRAEMNERR